MTRQDRQAILDDFIARHGRFSPAAFLAEASSDQHPAHRWFTWDDAAAANAHRIDQARDFIRDLRVTFSVEVIERGKVNVREVTVPAAVSPMDGRQGRGGYVALDAANMPVFRQEAASSLAAWLRRYEGAVIAAGQDPSAVRGMIGALSVSAEVA
jgi:hypothetical protein